MGREIKRVPTDFNHPIGEVWPGYLMPDSFDGIPCPDRTHGYSPQAQHLHDLWYGYIPFDPATTGSTPLAVDTPAVRAFAERNVANAPDFYGTGEYAIVREAQRLIGMWNYQWSHHLSQEDVNALLAAGRLMDFTHAWNPETRRREPIEPVPTVTPEQVNAWPIGGFGHDAINCWVVIQARCEREGFPYSCSICGGHATLEAYPGQRAEAEAWERTEPPEGDGWQLWETVSEGSPMSPVFATAEELAGWMSDPARDKQWVPFATAMAFIREGWASSGVSTARTGFVSGVEFVGFHGDGEG